MDAQKYMVSLCVLERDSTISSVMCLGEERAEEVEHKLNLARISWYRSDQFVGLTLVIKKEKVQ